MTSSCNSDTSSQDEPVLSILESVNGTMVNYYHVCSRKLWLFSRGLGREQDSSLVVLGRLMHEQSFSRRERELLVLGRIKIDHTTAGETLIIHEVKKTKSQSQAAKAQTLFYLYIMEQLGVVCRGELHYRTEKRRVAIELDDESRKAIKDTVQAIRTIKARSAPPDIPTGAPCSRCAYKDYCRT